MAMRQLTDGLDIKPGETVELSPGAYHLMFKGLKKNVSPGSNVKGSLTFEKAGSIDVEYMVEALGATHSSGSMPDGMQ
jgi:copper(I)-binding protein